ncbi:hypothetical protein V6N13_048196 [Hibiscus sabdariffa]
MIFFFSNYNEANAITSYAQVNVERGDDRGYRNKESPEDMLGCSVGPARVIKLSHMVKPYGYFPSDTLNRHIPISRA